MTQGGDLMPPSATPFDDGNPSRSRRASNTHPPSHNGALEHFRAAVFATGQRRHSNPQLFPERLSVAVTGVLPADGAGLSLVFASGHRMPVGASDPVSATAERLQFTVGEGPCLHAQDTHRPVLAKESELHRRWPAYTDELVRRTPYHGVASLPLPDPLAGIGALDLFFTRSDDVMALSLADTIAVTAEIAALLHGSLTVPSQQVRRGDLANDPDTGDGPPEWLDAPPARSRARVWQALGYLNTNLQTTSSDALALLRASAYSRGTDVDDLAGLLLSGELTTDDLFPGCPLPD